MTTTHPTAETGSVSVDLTAKEANAIVYAIALQLTIEGEHLNDAEVSTAPGGLLTVAKHADRITSLAAVGEQLAWRAHWGPIGGEPPAISAPEAVLLDLAVILHKRADEQDRYPDADDDGAPFEFGRAARTLAGAVSAGTR